MPLEPSVATRGSIKDNWFMASKYKDMSSFHTVLLVALILLDRINNRELGEYVARDIITRHLTQHDYDGDEEEGGGGYDGFHNSQFESERAMSIDRVKFHQFAAPKILDSHFPGGVYYFQSALPSASPTDLFLVTGPSDESTQRICGLRVCFLFLTTLCLSLSLSVSVSLSVSLSISLHLYSSPNLTSVFFSLGQCPWSCYRVNLYSKYLS
jgi:hypothetical protein